MKWLIAVAALLTVGTLPAMAQKTKIKTQMDSVSYAIGLDLGKRIQQDNLAINADILAAGIRDALAGKSALTDEQVAQVMTAFQAQMAAQAQAQAQAAGAKNKEAGAKFLADNAKRSGVTTTPSGLQYEVVSQGNGPKPSAQDQVTVHYTGRLIDGTVFDSSVERGEPATFALNQVIPGWTEGLQLMPQGSKYKLYIPSELAYGPQGAGQTIGPNSVLVFDVELLKVGQ